LEAANDEVVGLFLLNQGDRLLGLLSVEFTVELADRGPEFQVLGTQKVILGETLEVLL